MTPKETRPVIDIDALVATLNLILQLERDAHKRRIAAIRRLKTGPDGTISYADLRKSMRR